jgi:hypothetical protein
VSGFDSGSLTDTVKVGLVEIPVPLLAGLTGKTVGALFAGVVAGNPVTLVGPFLKVPLTPVALPMFEVVLPLLSFIRQ